MKIYVPGFPVKHVDEAAPTEAAPAAESANPLPSVAQAMAQANARQTQVLNYTRQKSAPSPLVQNTQPGDPTSSGQSVPHSVNDKPEVT
jgi:hypothetical protein